VANIFRTVSTKLYQNRTGFVDGVTKNIWCFGVRTSDRCSLTKHERLVSQGSVATLFRRAGKHFNYCIANLFRTMCTKFY